jgi:hypothetical protein
MSSPNEQLTFDYAPGRLEAALDFLKHMRYRFRTQRMVRVWPDRLEAFDVNGDSFVIRGLGYAAEDVVPVLDALNAAYKRETIHEPTPQPYKEFKTGRRYTWAADRVM